MNIQKFMPGGGVGVHRSWEDVATVLLALALIISPYWATGSLPALAATSVFITGGAIICVALVEILQISRMEEYLQLVLGAFVAVAALVLDYGLATELRVWHVAIGGTVALIAGFEIWQDHKKT